STNEFIKVIESKPGSFNLIEGQKIRGANSGNIATINQISENTGRFTIDYSLKENQGWRDDVGKLSQDYQVLPDNDYYQNLSYTVKSTIEWDKFANPVNRLVHPSGLKNFSDTEILSTIPVGVGEVREANQLVVLDVGNILELRDKQRVDAINNFDFARDFDTRVNGSKFLTIKNRTLT
ncbi:MAG: hypothetical protein VXY93_21310, partial [Pseudomonadota bacterium]|nr:hypothetical protein [Pseudomonadota bacterium]